MPPADFDAEIINSLSPLAHRIAHGQPRAEVLSWAYENEKTLLGTLFPALTLSQRKPMVFRLVAEAALTINVPTNSWAVDPLPLPDPQSRCGCGSGAKFRNCCGRVAVSNEAPMIPWYSLAMPAWEEAMGAGDLPYEKLDIHALALAASHAMRVQIDAPTTGKWLLPLLEPDQAHLLAPLDNEVAGLMFFCAFVTFSQLLDPKKAKKRVAMLAQHPHPGVAASATITAIDERLREGETISTLAQAIEAARARFPAEPRIDYCELQALRQSPESDHSEARKALLIARLKRDAPDLMEIEAGAESLFEAIPSDWAQLLGPSHIDAMKKWAKGYKIATTQQPDGEVMGELMTPNAIKKLEQMWRQQFDVLQPLQTLINAPGAFSDRHFAQMNAFVATHPDALGSFFVLDQIMLYAHNTDSDDETLEENLALIEYLGGCAYILALLLPRLDEAILPWMVPAHRPLLRCVAQYIDGLLYDDETDPLEPMLWMLRVNPNDNHGYRDIATGMLLHANDAEGALEISERYPNDLGECAYNHVLALFMLGRKAEAQRAWDIAVTGVCSRLGEVLLAAKAPKVKPSADGFIEVGGVEQGAAYRSAMLEKWRETGAIEWAKQQTKPKRMPKEKATRVIPTKAKRAEDFPVLTGGKTVTEVFGANAARLQGYLTAITWSAKLIMPAQWLTAALEMCPKREDATDEDYAEVAECLMDAYNDAVRAIAEARAKKTVHINWALPQISYDPIAWAAGFMRGTQLEAQTWKTRSKQAAMQSEGTENPIERLRLLAALARLDHDDAERVLDAKAQPLLQSIASETQPDTKEIVQKNLGLLWQVVGKESFRGG
jgi:yecA family protein